MTQLIRQVRPVAQSAQAMRAEPRRFSIAMATFNGELYIRQQLNSLAEQILLPYELVACDDGSSDNTVSILEEFQKEAPFPVTIHPNPSRLGFADNFLDAASKCTADWIAFSDQDDLWHSWKLSRAIDCLERQACECYSANVTAFWEDGSEVLIDKSHVQREFDYLFEGPGPGCTYVMSTRLAREIQDVLHGDAGIARDIALHDWFTYAWARSHRFAWFIDKKPVMRYRQHVANHLGVNVGSITARRRMRQIRSGWYRQQVEAIAKTCGVDSVTAVRNALQKGLSGRISLALHAGKFRRRRRDAFALALISLLGWF